MGFINLLNKLRRQDQALLYKKDGKLTLKSNLINPNYISIIFDNDIGSTDNK